MFVGPNLTNIRILHGFTRKQLAEELTVTEQAVWQYENGFVSPKMEIVNKLKAIFQVKSQYFYKEDQLSKHKKTTVNHNHIAYRSSVMNSIQKTQFEATHIENLIALLDLMDGKLQFPENRLRKLRNKVIAKMDHPGDRLASIRRVAEYARDFLGMRENSNNDLLFQIEKNGAFVFEKSIGEKIDAYSVWANDDTPYIMLGNLKKSAARRNFDLAHELGHLLLHYKVEFALQDKKNLREYEHEANVFAGSFLLPKNQFIDDIQPILKISHPDSYIELKRKWMVSIQAMAFRAHFLQWMSYQQYRYFNIMLNRLKYKEIEPLDKELPVPHPGKVKSILQLLFEQKYLTLDEIIDDMEIDIGFLANLTGIEKDFFKEYQFQHARAFSIQDLDVK
ncbi:ImmA/IrrE family metallo-endopeptidase [Salicibibacter cibarius]|uniref:ImmA/IrrE family metallo-endopeptidase n=1 Tax=Salicibibacter cibarius TaxID=2743000 RepID=A0A7T6Z3R9_9BACI|nr:XRE family transcriptional regulator [Salicibibacter cibarius]QQK76483.1 ImmA/IrrE family metallo-endopeptidase [Salicibibacter cibarius]